MNESSGKHSDSLGRKNVSKHIEWEQNRVKINQKRKNQAIEKAGFS